MADRWWRAYDRSRRDPKLQRLPAETFRGWYNLVCLSSEHGGKLPNLADTAFELRKSEEVTAKLLAALEAAELFEQIDGVWRPRKWNELQYKSDRSTDRVQAFRERQRNVSVTPSESESEAETERPVPNGTGAGAPDTKKLAFDAGVQVLTKAGLKEPQARSLIGKWRKDNGDEAVLAALGSCQRSNVSEPVSWITATFKAEKAETRDQRKDREIQEAIARSKMQ